MRKQSARGSISRALATEAALALADRDGFECVTMRAIATELDATPMALYAYFEDKDALYKAMREQVFARVMEGAAAAPQTWPSMLEGIARALHQVMREHPNWTPLLAHQAGFSSSGLRFIDKLCELMRRDALAYEIVLRSYGCVMSFAIGSVLSERAMPLAPERLALLKEHIGGESEQFASLALVVANGGRWDWDATFDLGLRSLLAGIKAEARDGRRTTPSKRRRRPSK